MSLGRLLAINAGAVFGLFTLLWMASLLLRDASIVDPFWGLSFVLVGWVSFALAPTGFAWRKLLVVLLVTIWGLRLSIHIARRNWGKGEDFRYRKWREEEGSRWWWYSLLKVFWLQALLSSVISVPLAIAQAGAAAQRWSIVDAVALGVWLVGFCFETGGDWQLAQFKADPTHRGQVMDRGLWRYTRHPNYFGDATQWWAYYLMAAAAGGWWTVFSPLLMTGLLLRVSGVALLEKTLVETKPKYKEYVESTSAFLPWFPRRRS